MADSILRIRIRAEYPAPLFRAARTRMRIRQSMGPVRSPLDNSMIESWHSNLGVRAPVAEARHHPGRGPRQVTACINEYNRIGRHSSLGMRAPITHELGAGS